MKEATDYAVTGSEEKVTSAGDWLVGGGQMGNLIRDMDWTRTPLGPMSGWPQSLRTTIGLCLSSRFPFSIAWGRARTQIYNDGYFPLLGAKHPRSMGQDFRECWNTAWPSIGDAFERALSGETSYVEDQQIFLDRNGYLEETYFTFSFSPIRDESGGVGGVFQPAVETTSRTLEERRARVVRDLVARTSGARSADEAFSQAISVLSVAREDVPFALFYTVDSASGKARLGPKTSTLTVASAYPTLVDLDARTVDRSWPIASVVRSNHARLVEDVVARFGPLDTGPYEESPRTALVLPLTPPGADEPVAVLVAGVSSRLPLGDAYRAFYDRIASNLVTSVSNALVHEEQERRTAELAALDRAKTAFFSNVSHEFRTPLTLMVGPLEDELGEREHSLPKPRRERIEAAHRNALRLQKLVDVLLDFSKTEEGPTLASFQPTDLATFTAEIASMFRSALERVGLFLSLTLPPLPGPVYVDRDMWEKIVSNLLSNAFKHTFEGGISVRLSTTEADVELTVSDSGVGIPEAEIPRIFDRFHRVQGARARTHEGTGIGLALVQELSRLHGGDVRVESETGRGSTFTVTIPRGNRHLPKERVNADSAPPLPGARAAAYVREVLQWADPRPGEEPSNRAEGPAGIPRPRILVADDNADMRAYVTRLLSPDHEVVVAGDGETALECARAAPPDLVLTDVVMPRLDGIGLLRALRKDDKTKALPVLLLTVRAGEDSTVEGIETGADDYLVKPFSAKELVARVRTHLALAKIRREWAEYLERANAELEAFSYSVSHDLRTPLRAIEGFSRALLTRNAHQLDADGKEHLDRIRTAVLRMNALIDELLNLSRVSRAPLHRQIVDLTDLVKSVGRGFSERHPGRHVELLVQDGLVAHADAHLVTIVLENLLDNAWKFTSQRAEAHVRVGSVQGSDPRIYFVEDDGAGFDPVHVHRLFQPFQRLHAEKEFGGTGVGLATVHRVVARHGGRTWAESIENHGATFFFTLSGPHESGSR